MCFPGESKPVNENFSDWAGTHLKLELKGLSGDVGVPPQQKKEEECARSSKYIALGSALMDEHA